MSEEQAMAEVITGEAVALELPVATFPNRIAALLLDMITQLALLLIVVFFIGAASRSISSDYGAAAFLTAVVLVLVGYPTAFETLSRGKTLGKMALGIRVVGDDGSPVRFRQALVRALTGVFEIWTVLLAPVGLITSIVSAKGKRVGDFFAGTYVIQERVPARAALPVEFAVVPPPLAGWAQLLQVSRLSDQTADAVGSYLRRFTELSLQAREALGIQLANAVAAQVSPLPPAGTPPAAYLSAVLAVRREHERARFAALQPMPPTPPGPWPPTQPVPSPQPAPPNPPVPWPQPIPSSQPIASSQPAPPNPPVPWPQPIPSSHSVSSSQPVTPTPPPDVALTKSATALPTAVPSETVPPETVPQETVQQETVPPDIGTPGSAPRPLAPPA
jgi:uncharacterized RDD family membrane protein YckC